MRSGLMAIYKTIRNLVWYAASINIKKQDNSKKKIAAKKMI